MIARIHFIIHVVVFKSVSNTNSLVPILQYPHTEILCRYLDSIHKRVEANRAGGPSGEITASLPLSDQPVPRWHCPEAGLMPAELFLWKTRTE